MSTRAYAIKHKGLGLCRNCPKPLAQGSKIYCEYHKEKNNIYGRRKEKKAACTLKKECLEHYGKICSCCGETIIQFLTLEHENGNGNNHRRKLFKHNVGGLHMYRWLKKNNFPKGYSILCMNCNWGTRYGNMCPHKKGEMAEWSKATVY